MTRRFNQGRFGGWLSVEHPMTPTSTRRLCQLIRGAAESPASALVSPIPAVEPTGTELDELVERISEAPAHDLALGARNYDLPPSALLILANMEERLGHDDLTIHKLRMLMGVVCCSEKLKDLLPGENDAQDASSQGAQKSANGSDSGVQNRGRTGKGTRANVSKAPSKTPILVHHSTQIICEGDSCPGCLAGNVHEHTPGQFLRIVGHAVLSSERHVSEQLRCNRCGDVFSAALPGEGRADGPSDQQYGH